MCVKECDPCGTHVMCVLAVVVVYVFAHVCVWSQHVGYVFPSCQLALLVMCNRFVNKNDIDGTGGHTSHTHIHTTQRRGRGHVHAYMHTHQREHHRGCVSVPLCFWGYRCMVQCKHIDTEVCVCVVWKLLPMLPVWVCIWPVIGMCVYPDVCVWSQHVRYVLKLFHSPYLITC